ncbi:hypothetical protein D3C76_1440190 [compost metagenome]
MGRGIRRYTVCSKCAHRVVNRSTLGIRVFAHSDVVGVIIIVHIGDGQAKPVFGLTQRDPICLAWHILAYQPHTRQVSVLVHHTGKIAPPGARLEKGRHERGA